MSFTLPALLLLITVGSSQAPFAPVEHARAQKRLQAPLSPTDSVRLLKRARKAQSSFEQLRVFSLPRTYGGGGSGTCPVRVGRWCYWKEDGDDDREPPPEPDRVRAARERLLAILDTVRALLPGDEWIAGQSVFYLTEAERDEDAVRVASACAARATTDATRGWCEALAGYALHEHGAFYAADSAYALALAAFPERERCRWLDLSLLLEDDKPYRGVGCSERDSADQRIWRLSQPLYLVGGNDFRSEIFSRMVRNQLRRDARDPMTLGTSDGDRELVLRYGPSRWYERVEPTIGMLGDMNIVGHDVGRASVNFIPSARALAAPDRLTSDDWTFDDPTARVNYSPAYLKKFHRLPRHQLVVFRRGDTALVVAAYDAHDDTTLSGSGLKSGLLLASIDAGEIDAPTGEVRKDAGASAVLSARVPWRPFIASIEVLDSARRSAVRARYAVRPPYATGRLVLSDLLLYSAGEGEPAALAEAMPLMLASDTVRSSGPLGVFWEIYGVRTAGEPIAISLGIERIGTSWMQRAAEALHLATRGAPVNVGWQEARAPADGIVSRAVAVDLSRLPPGRYRLHVTVTPRGDPPAVATREIELRRD